MEDLNKTKLNDKLEEVIEAMTEDLYLTPYAGYLRGDKEICKRILRKLVGVEQNLIKEGK